MRFSRINDNVSEMCVFACRNEKMHVKAAWGGGLATGRNSVCVCRNAITKETGHTETGDIT